MSLILLAAMERSKLPFYLVGGALAVWAVASAIVGVKRPKFPGAGAGMRVYLAVTLALVGATATLAIKTSGTVAAPPWPSANGDLDNHRVATGTEISSSTVAKLGVAWTMPLTASSIYGTFAANPVTDGDGVVYLQDLASNVYAVDLRSGRRLWARRYDSQDIGPNGVVVSGGVVFGATAAFAFALDAKTGRELWRNTGLVPAARQKAGGELASGFGIDIQPQVAHGRVYLSTGALLGGGIAYALDARTGRTIWSFDTMVDPLAKRFIAGGAWNPPAVGPDGTVYFGVGNMYQPARVALRSPGRRLYADSTVALDGNTGKLKWFYQAVPDDFHDWDMQLSPIYAKRDGGDIVLDAGKMGYVYAMDAATGQLLWKTRVGVHNGHDADGELAMRHALRLRSPLSVEPGIVGGVETNMAVAGGVVYVPVANLASRWSAKASLGKADFAAGTGEMVALDLETGRILWDTQLSQMADGAATVANDLVFTTTFDGYLVALSRKNGSIAWRKRLPAFTNAPVAIEDDTLITAASYPGGKGQTTEIVAFRLGAHGRMTPVAPTGAASAGGPAAGASVFSQNCSSCHTLAAARAHGTVGPDLDQLKPSVAVVQRQVTDGGGGMPAFGGRLTKLQIAAVAKYVSSVAGTK
jgi:outer membrane protein assembly factor BamB